MRRLMLVAAFALAGSVSINADVTLKAIGTGKGLGMSASMPTTTYVKGMKMRVDTRTGDTTRTSVFDVENQKMYLFDSKKKEADVWDMAAFTEELSKAVQVTNITSSVKPNGKTKDIAGKTANGYDVAVTVPSTVGGAGGLKMTIQLTGTVWIVKGAPGTVEFTTFYKAAAEKGWIFSDPRGAKGSPGQAKAMAEMYRQFASLGGVPYASEMDIKVQGDGPAAGLLARAGGMSATSTVESVETGALAADLFVPPAGYKLNQRK